MKWIYLMFVLIIISGCSSNSNSYIDESKPYSGGTCMGRIEYDFSKFSLDFEQIECGELGYGGEQLIKAILKYKDEEAKRERGKGYTSSGGHYVSETTIIIEDYKNKEIYPKISEAICDYFKEGCPMRGDQSRMASEEGCLKAYQNCIKKEFEEVMGNDIKIAITASVRSKDDYLIFKKSSK